MAITSTGSRTQSVIACSGTIPETVWIKASVGGSSGTTKDAGGSLRISSANDFLIKPLAEVVVTAHHHELTQVISSRWLRVGRRLRVEGCQTCGLDHFGSLCDLTILLIAPGIGSGPL